MSLNSVFKRAAKLTNVSERALYKWMDECKQTGKPLASQKRLSCGRGGQRKKRKNNFDFSVLQRVVHSFFERNELPGVPELTEYFRNDNDLPTVAPVTMHGMLKKLGFKFMKR